MLKRSLTPQIILRVENAPTVLGFSTKILHYLHKEVP
jgi:hypothetical protein